MIVLPAFPGSPSPLDAFFLFFFLSDSDSSLEVPELDPSDEELESLDSSFLFFLGFFAGSSSFFTVLILGAT